MIDITFDVRSDCPGKDPDSHSLTLRNYHRLLWSKQLPNGKYLNLNEHLDNTTDAGHYEFSSDSIVHTLSMWKRMQPIVNQLSTNELEHFRYLASTVGATTIFPRNRINGKNTINGERGFNRKINDRIDLTLECIRRYYLGQNSPLFECFKRYSDFFDLFVDFKGYVDFFLFQDLVSEDYSEIIYLHPFTDFSVNSYPKTLEEYLNYKNNTISFVGKRNNRIKKWCDENL